MFNTVVIGRKLRSVITQKREKNNKSVAFYVQNFLGIPKEFLVYESHDFAIIDYIDLRHLYQHQMLNVSVVC